MGQWHTPYRTGFSLNLLKKDFSLEEIYQRELAVFWTEATEKRTFIKSLNERCLKLFNKPLKDFIPKNTINNRVYLMGKKKSKPIVITPEKRKIYDSISREDLYKIIEVLKDHIEEESSKKEINNQKKKLADSILSISSIPKVKLLKVLDLPKSCFYDRVIDKEIGHRHRKDSKVYDIKYVCLVTKLFEDQLHCPGSRKVSKLLCKKGHNISQTTVNKIMRNAHLFASRLKKKANFHESKITNKQVEYLLTPEVIDNAKPNELMSADFSIISTRVGNVHLHVLMDIISQKIVEWTLEYNQYSKIVLNQLELHPDIKILNTDHGSQYFEKNLVKFLKDNNIQQSMGIVGKSTDNRWVEYFFGCLKSEYLSQYNVKQMGFKRLKDLIQNYVTYYNNFRINEKLNWMTPVEFEKNFVN